MCSPIAGITTVMQCINGTRVNKQFPGAYTGSVAYTLLKCPITGLLPMRKIMLLLIHITWLYRIVSSSLIIEKLLKAISKSKFKLDFCSLSLLSFFFVFKYVSNFGLKTINLQNQKTDSC